jgi:hypothetical protein
MRPLKILILLLLFPYDMMGQQLRVEVPSAMPPTFNYSAFDRQFQAEASMVVVEGSPAFYSERHIREITARSMDSSIFWKVQLDTAGKVTFRGYRGDYFYITEQYKSNALSDTDTIITGYYRQERLMRLDTVITIRYSYDHADTIIKFASTNTISYYRGSLLNEQNQYYNGRYLHKKIANGIGAIPFPGGRPGRKHVYLHKRLRTDYNDTMLYLSSKQLNYGYFNASVNDTFLLTRDTLSDHPYVRRYYRKNKGTAYVDGGLFREPHIYGTSWVCGTGLHQMAERSRRTRYGYTTNNSGLYDSFYSDYMDEDAKKPYRSQLLRFEYAYFR